MEEATILSVLEHEKPTLKSDVEAVIVALHLTMKSLGFRCIGIGEKNETETEKNLPDGWNKSSEFFSFQYKHSRSSMTFLIKAVALGEKLLIHGLAVEDNKIHTLELTPKDQIFPNTLQQSPDKIYRDLKNLVFSFKVNIINKMLPPEKEGYEQSTTTTTSTSSSSSSSSSQRSRLQEDREPDYDPLRVPGTGRRYPPSYGRMPSSGDPLVYPPVQPFGIGGHDVLPRSYPSFPSPPGNLIGPSHPSFGIDPYGRPGIPGRVPPSNRGRVPGARFDPYGPPTGNHFGEPDNDELPPPGINNMYL